MAAQVGAAQGEPTLEDDEATFKATRHRAQRSGIALARFLQATGLEVYQRHLGERLGRAAFAKDQHLLRLAVEEKKRVDPHFREVFNEAFGQIGYWDETYAKRDSHFDWFVSFDDVRGILEPLLPNKNELFGIHSR